jgi:hypothetical protein
LRSYDVPEVTGQVRTLIEWGDGGLAMLTDTGSLVLLTPVPEPGTWAMLSAGLICLLTIARRRLA